MGECQWWASAQKNCEFCLEGVVCSIGSDGPELKRVVQVSKKKTIAQNLSKHLVNLMLVIHLSRPLLVFITIIIPFVFAGAIFAADTNNNTLDTDLIKAAFSGEFPEVKRLLEKGANVNAKRDNGITALMGAAIEGHQEVVELLLAKEADVDAKIYFFGHSGGATACDLASEKGHKEIVKLLVRAGAFHEEKPEAFRETKVASPESNQPSRRRRD